MHALYMCMHMHTSSFDPTRPSARRDVESLLNEPRRREAERVTPERALCERSRLVIPHELRTWARPPIPSEVNWPCGSGGDRWVRWG